MAMAYGHVYVAQVAMGANDAQTLKAFVEAEAYHGPSLIIAYSHCIAHGYDMAFGLEHQKLAVESGYWPLYHYDPRRAAAGESAAGARLAGAEDRRREADGHRNALPADRTAGSRALPQIWWRAPRRRFSGGCARTRNWPRQAGRPRMNLTTRYLGPDARASVHARRLSAGRSASTPSGSSRTPAPRRSSCTRCSRSRSSASGSDTIGCSAMSPVSAEASSYFPAGDDYALGPDRYLEQLALIKRRVGVPVIGSLNGTTAEGWLEFARLIEHAGADALELNFYHVATDPFEDAALGRAPRRRHRRGAQGIDHDPDRGEAVAVLLGAAAPGGAARSHRRGRARALQPLLSARHRSADAGDRAAAAPVGLVRAAAAPALAGDSRTDGCAARWRSAAACTSRSTPSRRSWPAPTACRSCRRC